MFPFDDVIMIYRDRRQHHAYPAYQDSNPKASPTEIDIDMLSQLNVKKFSLYDYDSLRERDSTFFKSL